AWPATRAHQRRAASATDDKARKLRDSGGRAGTLEAITRSARRTALALGRAPARTSAPSTTETANPACPRCVRDADSAIHRNKESTRSSRVRHIRTRYAKDGN